MRARAHRAGEAGASCTEASVGAASAGRRSFVAASGKLVAAVAAGAAQGAGWVAARAATAHAGGASAAVQGALEAGAPIELRAAPATVSLVGEPYGATEVWAYGAQVPGPTLRVARGATLRARLVNALPEATTVHWHGIRVPNAMDGVPHLSQPPVAPGEHFDYAFACPDSGTYWYHPHLGTPEQVDRGLSGVLIVDDVDPPEVDREVVWLLDDWRLDRQARIVGDYLSFFDVSHGGRIGNTVTVNGRLRESEPVRRGERLRLRIASAANARVFALRFEGHRPWVIALDGQPLAAARRLESGHELLVGPGMRADLVLDCDGEAGGVYRVLDTFNERGVYRLLDLRYATAPAGAAGGAAAARARRDPPRTAAPNALPEPDLADALRIELALGGGMMGRGWPVDPAADRAARRARRLAGAKEADPAWTVNRRAHMAHGAEHGFEFTAQRGRTVLITLRNDTAWWHPMHLHGHSWRELSRNGHALADRPWRDTTLLAPGDTVDVAFVADNPGDWLLHCHVLEHHAGGMGVQFRVA